MKNNRFKKMLGWLIIIMMFLSMSIGQTSLSFAEETIGDGSDIEEIGLIITGTNVSNDLYLTKTDLEEIVAGQNSDYQLEDRLYSTHHNHGGAESAIELARGIDANEFLKKANITGAGLIRVKFKALDGADEDLSYDATSQSFSGQHYYYPNILSGSIEGAERVSPMLAFHKAVSETGMPSGSDLEPVTDSKGNPTIYPALTRGQKDIEDNNRCHNVKTVQLITVGDSEAKFFTITSETGEKTSYNMADLLLKGIETKTYGEKTCEGISIERLLKDAGINLDDDQAAVKMNIKDSEDVSVNAKEIKENGYFIAYKVDNDSVKNNGTLQVYGGDAVIEDVAGITVEEPVESEEPVEPTELADFYIYLADKGETIKYTKENMEPIFTEEVNFAYDNHGTFIDYICTGIYLKDLVDELKEKGKIAKTDDIYVQPIATDGWRNPGTPYSELKNVKDTAEDPKDYFLTYKIGGEEIKNMDAPFALHCSHESSCNAVTKHVVGLIIGEKEKIYTQEALQAFAQDPIENPLTAAGVNYNYGADYEVKVSFVLENGSKIEEPKWKQSSGKIKPINNPKTIGYYLEGMQAIVPAPEIIDYELVDEQRIQTVPFTKDGNKTKEIKFTYKAKDVGSEPEYEFNITKAITEISNGIKVTANVEQLGNEHESAAVIFQLIKENTPLNIVALEKETFIPTENIISHFPVESGNYDINVFVFDKFTSDTGSLEESLAKSKTLSVDFK